MFPFLPDCECERMDDTILRDWEWVKIHFDKECDVIKRILPEERYSWNFPDQIQTNMERNAPSIIIVSGDSPVQVSTIHTGDIRAQFTTTSSTLTFLVTFNGQIPE